MPQKGLFTVTCCSCPWDAPDLHNSKFDLSVNFVKIDMNVNFAAGFEWPSCRKDAPTAPLDIGGAPSSSDSYRGPLKAVFDFCGRGGSARAPDSAVPVPLELRGDQGGPRGALRGAALRPSKPSTPRPAFSWRRQTTCGCSLCRTAGCPRRHSRWPWSAS